MKKAGIFIAVLIGMIHFTNNAFAQNVNANDQCKKMSRGVNIIGYDHELWKDHTKGRFREKYFQMIKDAGFSAVRINLHPFSHMDQNFQIDPKWLETLDWVVKQAKSQSGDDSRSSRV